MKSDKGYTVVIPVYNRENLVVETIKSVLGQSHPPNKVIVVDDGSTDGSREAANQFSKVHVLRNPHKGLVTARQHGLESVNSTFVIFLDSDDLLHPNHAEILLGVAGKHPGYCGYLSNVVEFRGRARFSSLPSVLPEVTEQNAWDAVPGAMTVSPGALLLDTQKLRSVGGWKLNDVFTWLLLSVDESFLHVPIDTFYYRRHDGQIVNSDGCRRNVTVFLQSLIDEFGEVKRIVPEDNGRLLETIIHALSELKLLLMEMNASPEEPSIDDFQAALEALEPDRVDRFSRFVAWALAIRLKRDKRFSSRFLMVLSNMKKSKNDIRYKMFLHIAEKIAIRDVLRAKFEYLIYARVLGEMTRKWYYMGLVGVKKYMSIQFPGVYNYIKRTVRGDRAQIPLEEILVNPGSKR